MTKPVDLEELKRLLALLTAAEPYSNDQEMHQNRVAFYNAASALIEELKAAREDAARYRWLRMHYRFANDSTQEIWFDRSIHPDALRGAGEPAELDKAIDDARKESV